MTPTAKFEVDELATEILAGNERALSRGLSCVERGGEAAETLMEHVYAHTGRAHIVGITGSPGSGKSTLTRALARAATKMGMTVGVIAVDPSSPFSGGSILGDRIRMNAFSRIDLRQFFPGALRLSTRNSRCVSS